ncbi:unnamed protein product [Notodromas monacha]|uniref:Major vault protein n=1 Tax=Notodromas monacha TaxID=399045 RepID=A0A7R9BCV6_9CRUS|nr:unnamed protein product [Notodromas monacha]CAG0913005.1 unnamed protein product [Notodromas monacha]
MAQKVVSKPWGQQGHAGVSFEGSQENLYRVGPHQYLHVLDLTTNVTRLETGPQTYMRKDNERIVLGPCQMIIVPPRHFCIIENPAQRGEENHVLLDSWGQAKLQHAELEIRLEQDPFPLYPGEILSLKVTPLTVVVKGSALKLRATRDFLDGGVTRIAGEMWLFEGPGEFTLAFSEITEFFSGTYIPQKEVEVVEEIQAKVIKANEALKLRALMETRDRDGNVRVAGEEWLVKRVGAYLPGVHEEVVAVVTAWVLTETKAIRIKATRTFVDQFNKTRKNGDEWLVTHLDTETYIPGVYEEVKGEVEITVLSNRQYCVILNPVDETTGKVLWGQKRLMKGEKSFFLSPEEQLEHGIQHVHVLGEDQGLILRANELFRETIKDPDTGAEKVIERKPGDRWMIRGPLEYVPPVEVEVVSKTETIPLDENEGIYVRDIRTGKVRAVVGHTYLLNQNEELWKKELPDAVEKLLSQGRDPLADRGTRGSDKSDCQAPPRDKTRVVSFRVPHNAAVQIYDYKEKKARVIFGPDLVLLGPDEQFTQLSLSGGKPKRPNQIRSLALLLGPDFCADVIVVETADHARLSLSLAYNWHFDTSDRSAKGAEKLFSVPDFVGDTCKTIASRVRGAVAGVNFDNFHKNSAQVIREAVFGSDETTKKIKDKLIFPQTGLTVTSVDIQSVEPVDQRTRDSLQKSVQLAIEITTNSQEAAARHEAERLEQEAKGKLERQRIVDEAEAEKKNKELLELKAASAAVESCGQATAEARSQAEAARIQRSAEVEQARLRAEAGSIDLEAELEKMNKARRSELDYIKEKNTLELARTRDLAQIEVAKFKEMVDAIGASNLTVMASAGPDHQVRMLEALGLKATLITDGRTPINLLSTAQGLLGGFNSDSEPQAKRSREFAT